MVHVVPSLVINHQAAYVERSEKIRRLEEKVYGQAARPLIRMLEARQGMRAGNSL